MIGFHRRSNSIFRRTRYSMIAVAALVATVYATSASAIGLVYVDADEGTFSGTPNLSPQSAIDPSFSVRDNKWGYRAQGSGTSSYESGINAAPGDEDSPELTMTLTTANGLVNGTSYDVYVAYLSAAGANWNISAGLTSGNYTLFDRSGPLPFLPNAVAGTSATSAVWTTAPSIIVEEDRTMLLGKVGTATATGGQINVFINDLPTTAYTQTQGAPATYRSRLDGLAFVEAGSAISVTATLNRSTGQLTVSNPTGQSIQVVSYSITSAAGALNSNNWLSIANHYDGNNGGSFDSDVWNITAPVGTPSATTTLSEAEDPSGGNTGGALTAGGLNFGTPWIRTPIQDLQISLTLSNSSVITLTPQYTGTAIVSGDLNIDGSINLTDLNIFRANLHTNVSALTRAQSYQLGDLTGDLAINFSDFTAFRTAYNVANGAGAFELAFGAVPEPSAAFLLALGLSLLVLIARHRATNERAQYLAVTANGIGDTRQSGGCSFMRIAPVGCSASLAVITVLFLTAKADAVLVTGWGLDTGGQFATLTEGAAGSFSTTVPAGGDARPRALLSAPITLANIGDAIVLTGTASLSTAVGNEQFRFGLYNTNGHATGTLSGGLWNGADVIDWLGYMGQIGDSSALGADRIAGRALGTTGGWHSQTGAYQVGVVSTVGTTNIAPNTAYNFTLKLRRTGVTSYQTDYSFVGGAQNRSGSFTDNNLGASAAMTSFNAVGFLLNASTGAGTLSNIDVSAPKELRLRVNTNTGLTTITNATNVGFNINYYEIRSAGGALNLSGWNSLDDQDLTTGGAAWNEAGGSSGVILSEFNVQGTKSIAQSTSLSLGNAFNVGGAHDLTFAYAAPDGTLQTAWVEYFAGLTGDYNNDGKVDAGDYVVWRKTGINGAQGYTDWRANFGLPPGSGSGAGLSGTSAVPEPAAFLLILAGIPVLIFRSRR
jgi:hypothetical protein